MERKLDTNTYLDAVCQMLHDGTAAVPVPVTGISMVPFLRTGDFVYVDRIGRKLKKGDIVLFQRRNGQYILHRIHKIKRNGLYLIQGDSQLAAEPVLEAQLRAVVTAAKLRGTMVAPGSFRWWMFAYPWRWLAPWRKQIFWIRSHTKS